MTIIAKEEIKEENLILKSKDFLNPELLCMFDNATLICIDMANIGKVYELLKALGVLIDEERANIAVLIKHVEQIVEKRNKLDYRVNAAQSNILLAVDELYIDDILSNCENYAQAVFLFRAELRFLRRFQIQAGRALWQIRNPRLKS